MKAYAVTLDIWKMVITCMSYIALAFTAWVFLRLLSACFWLPSFLQKYQNNSFLQDCTQESPEENSKTKSGNEMRPVGCSGQRGCPAPTPRLHVERIEGGLLVAGIQIASTCQMALPVSAIIFLVIGSIITVIAYQGQTPEEDHEAYALRVSNSTNSRVLGPVCLVIALLMTLAGLIVCLLVKYAHSKEQKVCFHCPIHGDFFPIIPVPVSAVRSHSSSLFCSQGPPRPQPEPPLCPYSNLLSASNSVSSGGSCPVPKPFVINNSLKCAEYFWPLTVTHDIASFPASRTPSPTPINNVTDVENRDAKPVVCTALPEVTLVAPATIAESQPEL